MFEMNLFQRTVVEVLLVAFAVPICLFALWQLRILMPICWTSKLYIKYRQGDWGDPKSSGNYKKRTKYGLLWWGYDQKTRHEFIIFNGNIGYQSFQVQNHGVRFAVWGPRPKWMYPKEKIMPDLSESEIAKLAEVELGKLSPKHPMRVELEKEMAESVRRQITLARTKTDPYDQAVSLLYRALMKKPWQWEQSFALWIARRGKLIGTERCYEIGAGVCKEMGFTLDEARGLYKERYGHS